MGAGMPFRQPDDGYAFPDSLMRPPVMGIGDSMYNGMRSATINAEFAARSVPALVSQAVAPDYAFLAPRYPEVLLLDVEQTLREIDLGDLTSRLKARLRLALDNARRWGTGMHRVPAEHAAWDNIAQAGAEIRDVIHRDFGFWDDFVMENLPKLDAVETIEDIGRTGVDLVMLHMALNARFLFNPNGREELREMRPIDLVALRKPRTLVMNLGSNHGIIDITLGGSEAQDPPDPEAGLRSLAKWAEDMAEVAEHLAALPPETEFIWVNTVPLPSTVPNQMYPYNLREVFPQDLDRVSGYFPVYDNRLGGLDDYTQYSGRQMKALDDAVRGINERMVEVVRGVFAARGDDRVRFFRLDEALKRFDGKHSPSKKITDATPGARLERRDRRYSNAAIDFDNFIIFDSFREGGLASLDNHHPSGLGYSVLARELLKDMRADLPEITLNRVFISEQGDRIFSDPPGEYASILRILYRIRRRREGFRTEPDFAEANGALMQPRPIPVALDTEEQQVEAFVRFMGAVLGRQEGVR